ncbi:hypothetical protein K439DRAFT_1643132 [Ramaria rubella]|nr:hypothetical protein K439DRAFT_1643132 [Ramaria rubella]
MTPAASAHPSSIHLAWSSCPVPGIALAHPHTHCTNTSATTATPPHPQLYSQPSRPRPCAITPSYVPGGVRSDQ